MRMIEQLERVLHYPIARDTAPSRECRDWIVRLVRPFDATDREISIERLVESVRVTLKTAFPDVPENVFEDSLPAIEFHPLDDIHLVVSIEMHETPGIGDAWMIAQWEFSIVSMRLLESTTFKVCPQR